MKTRLVSLLHEITLSRRGSIGVDPRILQQEKALANVGAMVRMRDRMLGDQQALFHKLSDAKQPLSPAQQAFVKFYTDQAHLNTRLQAIEARNSIEFANARRTHLGDEKFSTLGLNSPMPPFVTSRVSALVDRWREFLQRLPDRIFPGRVPATVD
jgi:hypothetical protein